MMRFHALVRTMPRLPWKALIETMPRPWARRH